MQDNKKQSILNDQKLRFSIIQSFINNKLQPIPVSDIEKYPNWMQFGLIDDSIENSIQVINSNLEKIQAILESPESPNNREWRTIAQMWAEILYQVNENDLEVTITERVRTLENNVDKEFIPWVLENHQSLYYKRERKPITLSHINDYINHNHNDSKIAIIVIDGMSTDQWLKIKQCLEKQSDTIQFEENLVYAAIPTITSISRQTIASGNEPTFFKNDSQAFSKEESLWASNWQKRDKTTGYKKGLKLLKKDEIKELEKIIDKQSILIITDYLDKKIHEATNGKHEIDREIDYWIKNGILYSLIEYLHSHEFIIYLTSDHGNVETVGTGNINQGSLIDKEYSRVKIYNEYVFAQQAEQSFPQSILRPNVKDASHYFLYAPDRKSFRSENERQVTHGGLTIEEVIVPLIRIEHNNAP